MADLSSTKIYGRLTVIHDAILKANAYITGNTDINGNVIVGGDVNAVNTILSGDVNAVNGTLTGNLGVVDVNASGIVSGNGSGLTNVDAATVGGIIPSNIFKKDSTNTITGDIIYGDPNIEGSVMIKNAAGNRFYMAPSDGAGWNWDKEFTYINSRWEFEDRLNVVGDLELQSKLFANSNEAAPTIQVYAPTHGMSAYTLAGDGINAPSGTPVILHSGTGGSFAYTNNGGISYPFWVNGNGTVRASSDFYTNGQRVLHTGDMGSGNSLDADTVDGREASTMPYRWFVGTSASLGGPRWFKIASLSGTQSARYRISLTGGVGYSAGINNASSGAELFITMGNNQTVSDNLLVQGYAFDPSGGVDFPAEIQATGSDLNWDIWIKVSSFTDIEAVISGEEAYTTYTNVFQDTDPAGIVKTIHRLWHTGNDGSNSGLDADTVDGIEASQFVRGDVADTLNGATYLFNGKTSSAKVQVGDISHGISSSDVNGSGSTAPTGTPVVVHSGPGGSFAFTNDDGTSWPFFANADGNVYASGEFYANGNLVWNQGNMGTGSGLDADTVDGIEGSQIIRNDQDGTINGRLNVSVAQLIGNTTGRITNPNDGFELFGGTSSMWMGVQDGTGRVQWKWNATKGTSETYLVDSEPAAAFEVLDVTQQGDSLWQINYAPSGTAGATIPWSNIMSLGTSTFTYNGNTVWHAGNDGPGSTLDADTLDGKQLTTIEQDAESAALALAIALG